MKCIKYEEMFKIPRKGRLIVNQGYAIVIPESNKRKIIKNMIGGK